MLMKQRCGSIMARKAKSPHLTNRMPDPTKELKKIGGDPGREIQASLSSRQTHSNGHSHQARIRLKVTMCLMDYASASIQYCDDQPRIFSSFVFFAFSLQMKLRVLRPRLVAVRQGSVKDQSCWARLTCLTSRETHLVSCVTSVDALMKGDARRELRMEMINST